MRVIINKRAQKQIDSVPVHIHRKFLYWLDLLQSIGLRESRKFKGFHDEPLTGQRLGERSVRLSKSYRVLYRELDNEKFEIIEVIEVNKHEY